MRAIRTVKSFCFVLFLWTGSLLLWGREAEAKTLSLPLTMDYPLLRSLIVKNAFPDPGGTAYILDEDQGCRRIVLSNPVVVRNKGAILFETKVSLRMGVTVMGKCVSPVEWEGYVALRQKPVISPQWILSFETLDSAIYDKNHKPGKISGLVWDHVKSSVYRYMESITINLGIPIAELKSFLGPLFPEDLQARVQDMINTMRPGKIIIGDPAVGLEILTDVEETYAPERDREKETLSREQWARFIEIWEAWDAFLVQAITSLSKEPLTPQDRQILLDTILHARYRFMEEFAKEKGSGDFVREQFVEAWKRISPVFRTHLSDDPSKSLLTYLAFFTASDALVALDSLGPTLGLEVSRNGLIRLARLVSEDESITLAYGYGVDQALRETLGLGEALPISAPAFDGESVPIDPEPPSSPGEDNFLLRPLVRFFSKPAWAAPKDHGVPLEEIKPWVVTEKNLIPYTERVRSLLAAASDQALKTGGIERRYHEIYRQIVVSTAWQESCFKQFQTKGGRAIYIRSYNGTSVGIMQINERVWRGLYDEKHLRWDISYNARAGSEILDLYFSRYALKEIKTGAISGTLPPETLARAVYAMYNGGPGQFREFLKRDRKKAYFLSDKLFFEKYRWVREDAWDNIRQCLIGG